MRVHVSPMRVHVSPMRVHVSQVLALLNPIQRKWVYLEPIFSRGAMPLEQARATAELHS